MIKFQFFEDCPNAAATLVNLKLVMEQNRIPESSLTLVEVPSPELAEQLNFQGSPTILVDGKDLSTGRIPDGFSFNCRIYRINGVATGILTAEYIRERIRLIHKAS